MGWNDHRLAFAHYASSRIMLASDPKAAFQHLVSLLTATMLRLRALIYTARILRHNLLHTQLYKAMACVHLL